MAKKECALSSGEKAAAKKGLVEARKALADAQARAAACKKP